MWTAIISGAVSVFLKAVPWDKIFTIIFNAILTDKKANKLFLEFIKKVPNDVPIKNQDQYAGLLEELKQRLDDDRARGNNKGLFQ